jgi:hypothetical protein
MQPELIRLATQMPGVTDTVRQQLRRSDLQPQQYEQLTRELADVARTSGLTEIEPVLRQAVTELGDVGRNSEIAALVDQRVGALVRAAGSNDRSQLATLIAQVTASGLSERAKVEIFNRVASVGVRLFSDDDNQRREQDEVWENASQLMESLNSRDHGVAV